MDILDQLNERSRPSEEEILELYRAGDFKRAMAWLLFLPTTRGIPIVTRELMGDLICLHIEIMRLYRIQERYNKLMKETKDFRKQKRAKKIDRKSKPG